MSEVIYDIKNLTFSYGKQKVLDNLSFTIPSGKITTILGPNGCGKSTLFHLLTKNRKPDTGEMKLMDTDMNVMKRKEFARKVAVVHQYNTEPSAITVEKLVALGRTPYQTIGKSNRDEDEHYINWALEVTNLSDLRKRMVSELSGGQKQRVWIAMALAQNTNVLLLDEPSTYLDIYYQLEILRLIKKLNREYGITILMILHDINHALYYSDHIIAMKAGKIITEGEPQTAITRESMREIYQVDLEMIEALEKPFILCV